ncbi:uncharacterized protein LOC111395303 [Olea europaea var. sylvestris]|uniref:uncharacterized protein LOC111395303 n=1 Tax=Olea europaea var. sylvestris TaxID=158386 RepID=UPI000C1D52D0|nr:uncharacterized protein LOC111395303 [Olea europaea var. sylvestris]
MLRACVLDLEDNWELYLPLVEFTYDNSFQTTIEMALYEAFYGRRYKSHVHRNEIRENRVLGPYISEMTVEVVDKIRIRIKAVQDRQSDYADTRKKDFEFLFGEKVFLKMAPIKSVLRFGKIGKLRHRYIIPFEIRNGVRNVVY